MPLNTPTTNKPKSEKTLKINNESSSESTEQNEVRFEYNKDIKEINELEEKLKKPIKQVNGNFALTKAKKENLS